MVKLLFLDTETSSLDTERGTIQELAWAVYAVEPGKSHRLIKSRSYLLKWNMHYEVDVGALSTTGLTKEMCEALGTLAPEVLGEFLLDLEGCDAVCGHNLIDFDKLILRSNIKRALFSDPLVLNDKFTFDTMFDCPYKNPRQIMSLKYLAYDHGHILSNAHQALADVFACAHVFFHYPFEECAQIARTKLLTFYGHTEWGDEAGREAFYRQKFKWNREFKRWERKARAYYIPGAQLELGRDLFGFDSEKEYRFPFTSPKDPIKAEEVESPEIPF